MNKKAIVLSITAVAVMSVISGCGPAGIEIRPDDDSYTPAAQQQVRYTVAEDIVTAEPEKKISVTPSVTDVLTSSAEISATCTVTGASAEKSEEKNIHSENEYNSEPENNRSEEKNSEAEKPSVPETNKPSEEISNEPEEKPSPEVRTETPVSARPSDSNSDISPKYVDGVLIVNKSYPVPEGYRPDNMVVVPGSNNELLLPETSAAFTEMCADAWKNGLTLWVQSGFRSYELQTRLYNNYVASSGKTAADTFSARPGHSEHHTGLALDLNTITDSFAGTAEGKWVAENCWKYGFIIRYPKDKENITGYKYEPWHLRYLGKELAKDVYDSGLCLEEYFGLTSSYNN